MNIFLKSFLFLFVLASANADVVLAKVNGVNITENSAKEFLRATNPSLD
ncbi:MAG: hypothetical protein IE890_06280, partial [Arcobacter sp.]|nr:hypothetical protein [Arcobacter sp.]